MSPLIIDPGSTSGAVASDDLTLYSGVVVQYIADMPDTRDVGKITIGAFKRDSECNQSAPVTLTVREGPDTQLQEGEEVSRSLEPVDFETTASNLTFDMRPFTMRAGHSYSFIIYNQSTACPVGTRYTWPHNESTVTGGSASLCPAIPVPYYKYRIWHVQYHNDAPTCYLQELSYFDATMPTGWLQVGSFGFNVESFVVSEEGPTSAPCINGTQGVNWRPWPTEPDYHTEWVCQAIKFSEPSTPMTDGWYFAANWDIGSGSPRDSYLKLEPPDYQTLLEEHTPILLLDSGEDFFPQDAGAFTHTALSLSPYDIDDANKLFSGSSVLAAAQSPGGGSLPVELTLDTLGPTYNLGSSHPTALDSDFIDTHGSSLLEALADSTLARVDGFDGKIYGRFVQDPTDHKRWLQYWVFYYYNSYEFLGFGLHEGDWEMIQVGLDSTLAPDDVTFSIHDGPGRGCYWNQVLADEETGQRPLVFVGAGTHASYPNVGTSDLPGPTFHTDNHYGDGDVEAELPLEVANGVRWWDWPGRWGASTSGDFKSPLSPSRQGPKWTNPSEFADGSDRDHCSEE